MPHGASPGTAAFLSGVFSGLGHLYAGRIGKGLLFALGEAAAWAALVGWAAHPETGLGSAGAIVGVAGLLRLLSGIGVARGTGPGAPFLLVVTLPPLLAAGLYGFIRFVLPLFVPLYGSPSSAMEPTLMGPVRASHPIEACEFGRRHDPPTGDHLLVSRMASGSGPVKRFDVVVFRFPLDVSKQFVERVVGMPGEELKIHRGDLYVRREGEKDFRIARKPPEVQEALWVEVRGPDNRPVLANRHRFLEDWTVEPSRASLEVAEGTLTTFSGRTTFRQSWEGDVRISYEVEWEEDPGEVVTEIVAGRKRFKLSLGSGKQCQLSWTEPGMRGNPTIAFAIEPGRKHRRVAMAAVDGRIQVRIDGLEIGGAEFAREPGTASGGEVAIGAWGKARFRDLRIERDIVYRGLSRHPLELSDGAVVAIPEDSYLMFGDNPGNSHDSRAWVRHVYTLKDGSTVECEGQQVTTSPYELAEWAKENGLAEPPGVLIRGDSEGRTRGLPRGEIAGERQEPFRFIHRRFLVGRVVKVWWPLERAGPVR